MFTGLIEEIGTILRIEHVRHSAHIHMSATVVLEDVKLGDSIAVNGACLTVVSYNKTSFVADAVPETLRRTNLGDLKPGDPVNLERALRLGDRLGGHLVSGHVDGLGVIQDVTKEGLATVVSIEASSSLMRYVADKGSVCVNGVSLTVMNAGQASFRLSVIPHTGAKTTLLSAKPGDRVNLECDVLSKYVERLITYQIQDDAAPKKTGVTMEDLIRNGFA